MQAKGLAHNKGQYLTGAAEEAEVLLLYLSSSCRESKTYVVPGILQQSSLRRQMS